MNIRPFWTCELTRSISLTCEFWFQLIKLLSKISPEYLNLVLFLLINLNFSLNKSLKNSNPLMNKLTLTFLFFAVLCCSFLVSANKKVVFECSPASREGDFCPMNYAPVCGQRPGIRCFTTPCTLVTYPNACAACHDHLVESYTQGECTVLA